MLFAVLSRHGVEVLDVEQVTIRGQLVLGVLVDTDHDPEGLQEAVEQAMATVAMQVGVEVGAGRIDPAPLYTHAFPLAELDRAMETMRTRPDGFLKALVTP